MTTFLGIKQDLSQATKETQSFLSNKGLVPTIFSKNNLLIFFKEIPENLKLILSEPKILLFGLLQALSIGLGYFIWIQMLKWIPDSVWAYVNQQNGGDSHNAALNMISFIMLLWSLFIVLVMSYPIGLFSAAIIAVQDLRISKEKATLAHCLAVANAHIGTIWMFSFVDGWLTVLQIVDRLPSKRKTDSILQELFYYSWKLGTMMVVPSLINGRSLIEAGRDSVTLLKAQTARALGIRFGYSAICWVFGIATYILGVIALLQWGTPYLASFGMYNLYLILMLPIFVTTALISVLIRPFFLLSLSRFYTDIIDVSAEIKQDLSVQYTWKQLFFSRKFIMFSLLIVVLAFIALFPDTVGIKNLINHFAAQIH